jgi:hypothetical protein
LVQSGQVEPKGGQLQHVLTEFNRVAYESKEQDRMLDPTKLLNDFLNNESLLILA